jgi:hypothetical protein
MIARTTSTLTSVNAKPSGDEKPRMGYHHILAGLLRSSASEGEEFNFSAEHENIMTSRVPCIITTGECFPPYRKIRMKYAYVATSNFHFKAVAGFPPGPATTENGHSMETVGFYVSE